MSCRFRGKTVMVMPLSPVSLPPRHSEQSEESPKRENAAPTPPYPILSISLPPLSSRKGGVGEVSCRPRQDGRGKAAPRLSIAKGEKSARLTPCLISPLFSQGFAPHPTKGVRPLDTRDGANVPPMPVPPRHCARRVLAKPSKAKQSPEWNNAPLGFPRGGSCRACKA
jgi:hypothetical protein